MDKMTIKLNPGDYNDIQAQLRTEYLEPMLDSERKFQEKTWARYDAYYWAIVRYAQND